jgi:hypothetical protein
MLEEMAHAIALGHPLIDIRFPLLHPIGEISHGLCGSLKAILVTGFREIWIDSVLELMDQESAECAIGDLVTR